VFSDDRFQMEWILLFLYVHYAFPESNDDFFLCDFWETVIKLTTRLFDGLVASGMIIISLINPKVNYVGC